MRAALFCWEGTGWRRGISCACNTSARAASHVWAMSRQCARASFPREARPARDEREQTATLRRRRLALSLSLFSLSLPPRSYLLAHGRLGGLRQGSSRHGVGGVRGVGTGMRETEREEEGQRSTERVTPLSRSARPHAHFSFARSSPPAPPPPLLSPAHAMRFLTLASLAALAATVSEHYDARSCAQELPEIERGGASRERVPLPKNREARSACMCRLLARPGQERLPLGAAPRPPSHPPGHAPSLHGASSRLPGR